MSGSRFSLVISALATLSCQALGLKFFASTERFGYTGTISVYNTLDDARRGLNPRYVNVVVPQRDGSLYVVRNVPSFYSDFNGVLTNWYADGNTNRTGQANPNNQNLGFIQMYDENASNWANHSGSWSNDLQTFTVFAKGKNATYQSASNPGDYARLWNAGAQPGSGESTKGTFIEYEYRLVATGLIGADPDGDKVYENTGNAAGYSGYFRGIFRNESSTSPASNGYYVFNLTFNSTSWAASRGTGWTNPDRFGSDKVSP